MEFFRKTIFSNSGEAPVLESQTSAQNAAEIIEKLMILHDAASKTEQHCKDLQAILEKAQRASAKYHEAGLEKTIVFKSYYTFLENPIKFCKFIEFSRK